MNHTAIFLILFWIFGMVVVNVFICKMLRKYKAIEKIMNAPEELEEQKNNE